MALFGGLVVQEAVATGTQPTNHQGLGIIVVMRMNHSLPAAPTATLRPDQSAPSDCGIHKGVRSIAAGVFGPPRAGSSGSLWPVRFGVSTLCRTLTFWVSSPVGAIQVSNCDPVLLAVLQRLVVGARPAPRPEGV